MTTINTIKTHNSTILSSTKTHTLTHNLSNKIEQYRDRLIDS